MGILVLFLQLFPVFIIFITWCSGNSFFVDLASLMTALTVQTLKVEVGG